MRDNCVECTARILDSGTVTPFDKSANQGWDAFDMAKWSESVDVHNYLLGWGQGQKRREEETGSAASSSQPNPNPYLKVEDEDWETVDIKMEDASTEADNDAPVLLVAAEAPCGGSHLPAAWKKRRRTGPRYQLFAAAKDGCVPCTRLLLKSGTVSATDRSDSGQYNARDFAAFAGHDDVLTYLDAQFQ